MIKTSVDLLLMLMLTNGILLGFPAVLYILLLRDGGTLLPLQLVISGVYLLASLILAAETAAVLWAISQSKHAMRGILQRFLSRRPLLRPAASPWAAPLRPEVSSASTPPVSIVVVAYLPNEQGIILETLQHILTQVDWPASRLEVILAYNTPTALPIEADLQRLAEVNSTLKLLRVEGSTSKAQNLNAALQVVTGEMTCIFDADHHPAADCLRRAWPWLQQGQYDLVQGRNVIRNHGENWLTQLIAVEFECLYGVSHYGRSLLVDTALFGGSNGYWRTAALQRICFRSRMLTEDIDATLRALLRGYRIVHDPQILTTELAPEDVPTLWSQRRRWSQGWLEVALAHQRRVARSRYLDLPQRICWLIMLLYSEGFHPLALQIIPITLSLSLAGLVMSETMFRFTLISTLLTLLSGFLQVFAAMRSRRRVLPLPPTYFLLYGLLSPIYFWFKSLVAVVALSYHLGGRREWHVTRRVNQKAKVQVLDPALR
ncbi:MAG: glycosyltransferase family 2 protein [Cyanobacteria bacterium Co-bin13]|nr:glycosyltransferase family 2 protein [Cyanobacteria bacterium Co-bin13]